MAYLPRRLSHRVSLQQRGTLRLLEVELPGIKHAAYVVDGHVPEVDLGEGSPLAKVYELGGQVLLLGVGHANNTSLHLSEYRAHFPGKHMERNGAPLLVRGRREWVWYQLLSISDADFPAIGEDFAGETGLQRSGRVGSATALLCPQRPLVDYGVRWMEQHRSGQDGG